LLALQARHKTPGAQNIVVIAMEAKGRLKQSTLAVMKAWSPKPGQIASPGTKRPVTTVKQLFKQ
jgi:hypothetical protein